MPSDERPQERLELRGPAALSDEALLPIILPNGIESVIRGVDVYSSTDRDRDTTDAVGVANADGEARTRRPSPRSVVWVRGRWTGSWVRAHGTEWRAGPDHLRRLPRSTITRSLERSSSPDRSSAARRP